MANFDFLGLKKLVQSAQARLTDVRTESAALQQQREALRYAPQTRETVKTMIDGFFSQGLSADAKKQIRSAVQTFARTSRASAGGGGSPLKSLLTEGEIADTLLRAAVAQQIGAIVGTLIDSTEWPADALDDASRQKRMTDLDSQISKLMAEEADLVQRARDAGLELE